MYRASRVLSRRSDRCLQKNPVSSTFWSTNLSYHQKRTANFDSNDPVFVNKLRTIAGDYMRAKNQKDYALFEKGRSECWDLVNRAPGFNTTSRKELYQILDGDAQTDTPKWTKEERKELKSLLWELGIGDGISNALIALIISGADYLLWIVFEKPNPWEDDESKMQRQVKRDARREQMAELEQELRSFGRDRRQGRTD